MPVVKINAIDAAPEQGAELERRFAHRAGLIETSPGFLGFQLLRPVKGETRYFIVTQWQDDASYEAWLEGAGRTAHSGQHQPVSAAATVLEFEVVMDVKPQS